MASRTRRSIIATGTVVACLLVSIGCSSTVKSKMADVATGPACSAISNVQGRLSGATLATLPPDQIEQVQNTAKQATTAIDALGDTVPSELRSKLDDAQKKLDDAVADKTATAEQRRENISQAADDYVSQLDQVKSDLGC